MELGSGGLEPQQEASSCGEAQSASFLSQHCHLQGLQEIALHGAAQTPLKEKHSEQSQHGFFFFSSASCLLVFYLRAEQKSTRGWQMHGPTHNNSSFQIQGDYIFTPNLLQAGLYRLLTVEETKRMEFFSTLKL